MDEQKLIKYYGEIANTLDEIIPCEWEKIVLYVENTGSSGSAVFYFWDMQNQYYFSNSIPKRFNVDERQFLRKKMELYSIGKNMRKVFIEEGEEPWLYYVFTLNQDWTFNMRFGYELDLEIGDFERQIRWQYDELGIVSEGEYGQKVLEDYLKEKNSDS